MSTVPKPLLVLKNTHREKLADFRFEYYRGEMFAGGALPTTI